MKKDKSIKLQLIRMLSDPYVCITSLDVSNEIEIAHDNDVPLGTQQRKLTGHSTYIIKIYKEPKDVNSTFTK